MSDRFYNPPEISPDSRGGRIKAAIHGPTSAMLNVLASTPLPQTEEAAQLNQVVADMIGLSSDKSSRLAAHRLKTYSVEQARAMGPEFLEHWKAARATSSSPTPAPAAVVAPKPVVASVPKPMPVPSSIEANGADCVSGYRKAYRAETSRLLNLIAQPSAKGRHLAVVELAEAGLNDAQILARLPNELTDDAKRAMKRQAEASALWDKAIASAFPGHKPAAKADTPNDDISTLWERAIARNNPGYKI